MTSGMMWQSISLVTSIQRYVNWNNATSYANSASKRFPTEAEWEYTARGELIGKRYPLGDEITRDDANWGNMGMGRTSGTAVHR